MSSALNLTNSSTPSRVSAFAVYKNLIPGVKVYEDHNNTVTNIGKKRKKNKKKVQLKEGIVEAKLRQQPSSNIPSITTQTPNTQPASPTTVNTTVPVGPGRKKQKRNINPVNFTTIATPIPSNVIQFIESKVTQFKDEKDKDKEQRSGKKRKSIPKINSEVQEPIPSIVAQVMTTVENGVDDVSPKRKKPKKNKNDKKVKVQENNVEVVELVTFEGEDDNVSVTNVYGRTTSQNKIAKSKKLNLKRKQKEKKGIAIINQTLEDNVGQSGGNNTFKWLIHPTTVPDFFSNFWEKKPLLVKRKNLNYYGDLLTSGMLDTMLRKNNIRFGKNIDVTSYTNGQRETHNPVGRAMPPVVWDYFANGCSIRLLNPQTYITSIWKLNSSLQDYVGTFVGANVYLTPKNSQGFAPHWDDIEAFVLQLEGTKRWRVYEPLEKLPKASSENLKDEIIGKPILDVTLEPGDLLYFPRGFIHQANAIREHSLHITLSCYQNNSYSDFLKEYLPMALDHTTMENVAHREGLPRDYLQYMGVAHVEREDLKDKRLAFTQKIKKLTMAILDNNMIDFAADQMGKKIIWDSLPPFIESSEIRTTVSSDTNYIMENGSVDIRNDLDLETDIRLLRSNCLRLVIEEGCLRLYFSTENSLEYHGEEVQFIEMVEEAGPAIEFLIAQFPRYVKIQDLPVDNDDDLKLQIASDLWEKGIVRTKL